MLGPGVQEQKATVMPVLSVIILKIRLIKLKIEKEGKIIFSILDNVFFTTWTRRCSLHATLFRQVLKSKI